MDDMAADIDPNYVCRVCGLVTDYAPWGEDGTCAMFIICSCCGSESGYHDFTVKAIRMNRERWIAGGLKWSEPREKPAGWSWEVQARNIPEQYR